MHRSTVAAMILSTSVMTRPAFAAPQLGTVDFPTSCLAAVQPTFERGLALLHSFQYEEADQVFEEVSRRDPRCAMAHWGKAMVLYHQLWGEWPDAATFKKGRQEVARAQKAGAATPRERAYIAAAAAFFQDRPRLTHAARVMAYSQALEALHHDFPQDYEATAFYALSLVALAGEHVDDLSNLRQAISILQPLLRDHPNHPGAAHYLIHAADRPELASMGLEAARKYADIAPDSSHALHMPSHIFVRLGLWQETIDVNIRAAASGAHAAVDHHGHPGYQLHAMDFLAYAYLQRGREAKARQVLAQLRDVPGASDDLKAGEGAYAAARTAIELHRWTEAAALPIPKLSLTWLGDTYRARAIGAARSGDVASAHDNIAKLRESVRAEQADRKKAGVEVSPEMSIDQVEAEAWVAFADGKSDQAVADLRRAADREDAEGGESVAVPAREMLADLLLDLKRPSEALPVYKAVLASSPNRFDALYGAGRAARMAGDRSLSNDYFRQLLQVAAPDADRPEITEARAALSEP